MVLGIAILYIGFNYLKGQNFFSSNDKYYAIYTNVDGLNKSNPVMINGFTVGRVSDIRLLQNDGDKVLVELDIRGDIILGDSATATLNSDFLGNKSISLLPGDISLPLESGDTLIANLDRALTDILAESAQPVANNIEATIKKLNTILDNISRNGGKLDTMMLEFSKTPKIVNGTLYTLRDEVSTLTGTYKELGTQLNARVAGTKQIVDNLTVFSDSLSNLELNTTINRANKAIDELSKAIENFSRSEGTIGKLINDDSLYVNLNKAAESLDRLLIHLDTSPKHFFSPFGKSADKIERDRRKQAKKGN